MTSVAPAPLPTDIPPLTDSTPLLPAPDELRRRAEAEGYLFFRGLLPAEEVRTVRDLAYDVLARDRVLVPGRGGLVDRAHVDAVPADRMRLDIGIPSESYVHVQQIEQLHRLPHHPALTSTLRALFGEEVFVHPRHIVRAMTGHPALAPTPPHQDFPLVQGSTRTWTVWFPLDDCPLSQGPLAVLRGSHHNGYLPVAEADGAGNIQALLCSENDWAASPMQIGDVLAFSCHTVHRAVPVVSQERIRLSLDVRYQPASQPVEQRSLNNHAQVDWSEIYAGWTGTDLQYYWKSDTPRLSAWDPTLMQPGRRIC